MVALGTKNGIQPQSSTTRPGEVLGNLTVLPCSMLESTAGLSNCGCCQREGCFKPHPAGRIVWYEVNTPIISPLAGTLHDCSIAYQKVARIIDQEWFTECYLKSQSSKAKGKPSLALYLFKGFGYYILSAYSYLGASHLGASGKEPMCQCRRHKRLGFAPWVGKIPWRRKWQPTPVFLPGESHGLRSLEGYNPWGRRELPLLKRLSMHTFVS